MIKNMKGTLVKLDPAAVGIEILIRICLPKVTNEEEERMEKAKTRR